MISPAELIKQISGTIGKTKVLTLSRALKEPQFALRDLIDITFHPDKNIAFRAAGILENAFLTDPLRYEPDLEYMVSRIKEVKHESCKRHYAKIMMHITNPKALPVIKNKLQQIDLEPTVEQCFDWMIDPKVKIAVKVFASEALFNLRFRYPWIKEELAEQIHFLMRNGTPAILSRGRKLLALL
ncbi:hypothetical protein [Mucilaginibacter gotjawali]|uniref:Uncharacterized protein n=2 Tax=Mucilaginibacter gotjawali TaxID=1550579 RepID=A0A0X8X3H0_9SPHI|nr:hypothetical protein [Mucilaginibacter gotjawali]MBB3056300.1 hypothetical protein [Mucilaginibacter gotjawali]BAU55004.1 hypothetical protein MgSA37_03184 [Mucilaginibacter gotjawali]